MNLEFSKTTTKNFTSTPQKIRELSERWTEENIFCPNCGRKIKKLANNKKASDFFCTNCLENYEQKASQKKFKGKVISSEYKTIITRLQETDKPNFFFLHYLASAHSVNDFFVVPKYFFVPEIIEKRKALSENARRSGWVGSYILFSRIPDSGKIYYVEGGREFSKKEILTKWQKTAFLRDVKKPELKGWILDIMNCIDALGKKEFSLNDMYSFDDALSVLHPENKHIKDKIRQQLQFLRDKNYIEFLGGGMYRLK